jgi:hypothetical protein
MSRWALSARNLRISGTRNLALVVLCWCAASAAGRTHPSARTRPSTTAERDYVVALATANRFLQAWHSHDQETGLLLLSDSAKQHTSADKLEAFFVADWRTAYEIGRGQKIKAGRYTFPVSLFEASAGQERRTRLRSFQLIVTRTGKDDWAIDKLP